MITIRPCFMRVAAVLRLAAVGILLGLLMVYGPAVAGAVNSSPDAAPCQTALDSGRANEYGSGMEVYRAEPATVAGMALWQEQGEGYGDGPIVSHLRSFPLAQRLTVCLYTGSFVTPVGPGAPPHDLLRLFVLDDGRTLLDSAGYRGQMKPEMPSDSPVKP